MTFEPPMPADFPGTPYESVEKRVSIDLAESFPDSRREFAGGWNALRYRYLSCYDHDRDFTLSIQRSLTHIERYQQERDLFGFFVTGQSAVESLCYGLYAVASVIRPLDFPVQTKKDLKNIEWRNTARLFAAFFSGEALTGALERLTKSPEFEAWREQRNILAHRATPGRVFNQGGYLHGLTEWSGIKLDGQTTFSRRQWLTNTVSEILFAADAFTAKQLPPRNPSKGP